jgi:hypothetical protein
MTKLTSTVLATLAVTSAAFAPQQTGVAKSSALSAKGYEEVGGVAFDPLSLAKLGTGDSFDTFPNMFPNEQFLKDAEIKHGRQAMLAWTGVWATHQVRTIWMSQKVRDPRCPVSDHVCCRSFNVYSSGRTGTWHALPWRPR